jgi:hypothetical protein
MDGDGMSEQDSKNCGCPEGRVRNNEGRCVMPEVSFSSFILSLNTSALYHMGEIADPHTGQKIQDLDLAKNAIDTLTMLKEKTEGNLDSDEGELLTRIVYELKMRFVQVSHGG